ncbi:hypothetical protein LN042_17430 [Kitasatospora sp. RB6PN24]|uniref:hypothetical protein n=1 Tax=Kitasatospora humi TaxID=2893891 RepID=UPI001E29BFAC|nr:hypothetical protein [Kitasatospora humi]MCC9308846.1 hypothetical protein [Kitasatospora humi]
MTRSTPHRRRPAGSTAVGGTFFVLAPALTAGATVTLRVRRGTRPARQLAALAPANSYLTPPQLRAALAGGARFGGRVRTGSAPADAALPHRVGRPVRRRRGASTR